jgi:hypothetical protein
MYYCVYLLRNLVVNISQCKIIWNRICINISNEMQLYLGFYFKNSSSTLHVSGIHHAHHQEYHYCIGSRWYDIL